MTAVTTPADLTITPRDLKVDRNTRNARWWHGGDPIATAYFNALSAAFPQGETFFIESVRRYRDQVDEPLREQIAAFVQQEAMHTREHVVFNKLLRGVGYDLTAMDAETRRRVDEARTRPPVVQLALTVALEHFTAIMAHSLLTERQPLPGTPEEIVRLWQWHAIEEIEHKAVAYDTFLAVTRHVSGLRRWALRCHIMALVSLQFWYSNFQRMADFFRQDGMNTPRTWLRVAKYLLVKPGMMRRIFWDYLRFYGPGFHPWHRDDRPLIAATERQLGKIE
ncbi:MAG TPA: metal-dependent hydrolase [Steroidobacteraceae bacterium]|jgi:predicted metal-dependent hydrolase|nr:metal-dependent hydrolase [Steroidobacteraceae bacterium]